MAGTELLYEYQVGGQTFYQPSAPKIGDVLRKRLEHDCLLQSRYYRLADGDGRRATWLCCEVCGRKVRKTKPPLSAWVEDGDDVVARRQADWQHRLDCERERLSIEAAQEAEQLNATAQAIRRAEYNAYLRSDAWRHRRALVLKRCKGMCEGCGERLAVEVHHRTYRHFGHELLFELVGLCASCHGLVHHDADYDDLEE